MRNFSFATFKSLFLGKQEPSTDSQKSIMYFLHIPKTAGTSFALYLRSHYDKKDALIPQTWNQLYRYMQKKQLGELPYDVMAKKSLVIGHYGFDVAQQLRRRQTTHVVTILRDPLDRTISQLCHIKSEPTYNNWVRARFCLPEENIDDMVNDPVRLNFFKNYQARYLAATPQYPRIVEKSGFNGSDLLFDSCKAFVDYSKNNEQALLQQAMQNCDSFLMIGIQDYLEETSLMLASKTGWQPPQHTHCLTSTTNKEQKARLLPRHIKKIKDVLTVDTALYRHYKKQFERDYLQLVNSVTGKKLTSWRGFMEQRSTINKQVAKALSKDK